MPIIGVIDSAKAGNLFPSGSYDFIASYTPSGSVATFSFTSIPATYANLQIRYVSRTSTAALTENILLTFNNDTTASYARTNSSTNGTALASTATSAASNIILTQGTTAATNGANSYASGVIDIPNYTNTSYNKSMRFQYGWDNNGAGGLYWGGGLWVKTAAISTITFASTGNYTSASFFALYGIKGA